jgi:hypothetical protein
VRCGTLPSPSVISTPDRELLLVVDQRSSGPGEWRPRNRGRERAQTAATVERLSIALSVAERTPRPPGRPSGHARTVRGRRAADARRNAIRLLDIGVLAGGANDRPQPAAGAPSSPARRPGRLAFYMGCCPHRREGPVTCGTLPSPSAISTPDRGLRLVVQAGVCQRSSETPVRRPERGVGGAVSRRLLLMHAGGCADR